MTCRRWDSNPHCLGPKPSASAVGLRRIAAHLVSPAAEVYLPLVYYVVVLDNVHPLVLGDSVVDVSGQELDPVPNRHVLAQIGRAHAQTPLTNPNLDSRLLREKK